MNTTDYFYVNSTQYNKRTGLPMNHTKRDNSRIDTRQDFIFGGKTTDRVCCKNNTTTLGNLCSGVVNTFIYLFITLGKWAIFAFLTYSALQYGYNKAKADFDLYKAESACVAKHIRLGVPRIDIKTANGTCKVVSNGYYK